jgi:histone acetyltransferase HTATIP
MIKYYKGQHIIHLTDAVIEQQRKQSAKQRILVDPSKLKWKPYVHAPWARIRCLG